MLYDTIQTYLDLSSGKCAFRSDNKEAFSLFKKWKKAKEEPVYDSQLSRFIKTYADEVMEEYVNVSDSLDALRDSILDTYPMLKWARVGDYDFNQDEKLKDLKDYVKMVDQSKEEEEKNAKAA